MRSFIVPWALLFQPLTLGKWCGPEDLLDASEAIRLAQIPNDCAWLGLGGLTLTPANLHAFATVLRTHDELVHLGLGSNHLGDAGVAELAEGLRDGGSNLEWLSLHSNRIGDRGAAALGAALHSHPALRMISLWENDIGDDGLAALGAGLVNNTALEKLSLALNPRVTDAGLIVLADALRQNTALRALWLWGCPRVTAQGAAALAAALLPHAGHVRVFANDDSDDAHPNCAAWARDGECRCNPAYMAGACATSCSNRAGRATRRSTDGHPECAAWAMQEEGCAGNAGAYMRATCAAACLRAESGVNTHPHAGQPRRGLPVRGEEF
jgi:hypothetical protein